MSDKLKGKAAALIMQYLKKGYSYLTEPESKAVLSAYGLRCVDAHLAKTPKQAVKVAEKIGYPIVMKIVSRDVIHKSDMGGVRLNLKDEKEVKTAFEEIEKTFKDKGMQGVSVQKMADKGIEVIIGVTWDETFGHVVMFGLGGIFVDVFDDVSFRSIPLDERDAEQMVKETKGYKILQGYRGKKADLEMLKYLILRVSDFVQKFPMIEEMDLNPVFLYESGYKIVDARIILQKGPLGMRKIRERINGRKNLMPFFYPKGIAVIGASNTKGKLGWNVFHNLLTHGYKGGLYPVNPNSGEIQGVKSFRSVKDLKGKVDVAVVLVPAELSPKIIEECYQLGIKHFVIESAGFSEFGERGREIQEELRNLVKRYGIRIIGPNCSGIINTYSGVVESIGVVGELRRGNIGLVAQAGVYAAGYLWGLRKTLDFGIIATIGNKVDVDETDMLEFLGRQKEIKVICMYIEDIKAGRRFLDIAKKVSKEKPIVVLKTGKTEEGKKAVSSHTASLAGSDRIYEAVFRQSGVIRARDNEHMFALAKAFSKQPVPKKDTVFVVTYAGSLGVASADALVLNGLKLYKPEGEIERKLREILPKVVSGLNPLDFTFDQTPDHVRSALQVVLESEEVGGFIVIIQTEKVEDYIETLKSIDFKGRPVLCVVVSKEFAIEEVIQLENAGFPVYSTPEEAASVLATMYFWQAALTDRSVS